MKRLSKAILALGLSFGPLFLAAPAWGDTIQFTYYWTAREFTFTDQTVSVVVTNDITNRIGPGEEIIDTYRITLGSQVIEVREKHGPVVYTFDIVGTQVLKLEGIDNGFWAGNYGPIMEIVYDVPVTDPPVSESPTVSQDVSESPTISESVSETISPETVSPEPTQSAIPTPEPLPAPEPQPVIEWTPPPSPDPEPIVEPVVEPTVSESVAVSESIVVSPSASPTVSAQPVPSQSPVATQSPVVVPSTLSPEPVVTIQPQPSPEPTVEETAHATSPQPTQEVTEVPEETQPSEVSVAVQAITAIGEALQAFSGAVGDSVEVVTTAGLDMTPEQREEAQDVVVSAVIVSQVASAASIRKIK